MKNFWTLDKSMASLSTCHLGLCLGWQILLNLVQSSSAHKSAANVAKYCALIIICHNRRFIYYANVKLARILQFDMFVLCKA